MKYILLLLLGNLIVWLSLLAIVLSPQPSPSLESREGLGVSYPNPTRVIPPPRDDTRATLLTTGDVLLARTINAKSVRDNNFDWPFAGTTNLLSSPDLTFINLETPLIEACPELVVGFKFCGSSRTIPALVKAGIDIVNLANNHSTNFGQSGFTETVNSLKANNLLVTDSTMNHELLTINHIRFAFLGFDDTISSIKLDQLTQLIQSAKTAADHVVVAIHWGVEYQDHPSARQKLLGHLAIDSGASLVVGNHPHWIQPIEQYHAGYIYYSHGNFIFDQFWSEPTKTGLVITTTFSKEKIIDVKSQSIYIDPPGVPRLLSASGGN